MDIRYNPVKVNVNVCANSLSSAIISLPILLYAVESSHINIEICYSINLRMKKERNERQVVHFEFSQYGFSCFTVN